MDGVTASDFEKGNTPLVGNTKTISVTLMGVKRGKKSKNKRSLFSCKRLCVKWSV